MFKRCFGQNKKDIKKKGGQGTFKHMIYLPLPFCRMKRFWPKKRAVYDLPFFGPKKREVDHKMAPLDGLNI